MLWRVWGPWWLSTVLPCAVSDFANLASPVLLQLILEDIESGGLDWRRSAL